MLEDQDSGSLLSVEKFADQLVIWSRCGSKYSSGSE